MNLVTTIKICFVSSYVFLCIHSAPVLPWTPDISEEPPRQENKEDISVQNHQRQLGAASTNGHLQDDEDLDEDGQKRNENLYESEYKYDNQFPKGQDYQMNLENGDDYDGDENDQYYELYQEYKDDQYDQDRQDYDEGNERSENHHENHNLRRNEKTQEKQEYEEDASDQYYHYKVNSDHDESQVNKGGGDYHGDLFVHRDFEINLRNKDDEIHLSHQNDMKNLEHFQDQNEHYDKNSNQGQKDDQGQKLGWAEGSKADEEEDRNHEEDVRGVKEYHDNNHEQYHDKHDVLNQDKKINLTKDQNDQSEKQNQDFENQNEDDEEYQGPDVKSEVYHHYYDDVDNYHDDSEDYQNQLGDSMDSQDQEQNKDRQDVHQISHGSQEKYIGEPPVPSRQNRTDIAYDRLYQNNKDDQDHNIEVAISLPARVDVKLSDVDCTANVVYNKYVKLTYGTAVDLQPQGSQLETTFLTTKAENIDAYFKVDNIDETRPGKDLLDLRSSGVNDENKLPESNAADVVDQYEPDELDHDEKSSELMTNQNKDDLLISGENQL